MHYIYLAAAVSKADILVHNINELKLLMTSDLHSPSSFSQYV